jgi:hypothetical protein
MRLRTLLDMGLMGKRCRVRGPTMKIVLFDIYADVELAPPEAGGEALA